MGKQLENATATKSRVQGDFQEATWQTESFPRSSRGPFLANMAPHAAQGCRTMSIDVIGQCKPSYTPGLQWRPRGGPREHAHVMFTSKLKAVVYFASFSPRCEKAMRYNEGRTADGMMEDGLHEKLLDDLLRRIILIPSDSNALPTTHTRHTHNLTVCNIFFPSPHYLIICIIQ